MDITTLILSCTVALSPEIMSAVIDGESGGDPLLVTVTDTTPETQHHPKTAQEAVAIATALIADGHRLRLGLTQMSSDGLAHWGLTLEQAFDPCESVRAGEMAVMEGYIAGHAVSHGQPIPPSATQPAHSATTDATDATQWQFAPVSDGFSFSMTD